MSAYVVRLDLGWCPGPLEVGEVDVVVEGADHVQASRRALVAVPWTDMPHTRLVGWRRVTGHVRHERN